MMPTIALVMRLLGSKALNNIGIVDAIAQQRKGSAAFRSSRLPIGTMITLRNSSWDPWIASENQIDLSGFLARVGGADFRAYHCALGYGGSLGPVRYIDDLLAFESSRRSAGSRRRASSSQRML